MEVKGISIEVLSNSWYIDHHEMTEGDIAKVHLKEGSDEVQVAEMLCREGGVLTSIPKTIAADLKEEEECIVVRTVGGPLPEIEGVSCLKSIATNKPEININIISGQNQTLQQWESTREKLAALSSDKIYCIVGKSHRFISVPSHPLYCSSTPSPIRPIPLSGRPVEEHIYHISLPLAYSLILASGDDVQIQNETPPTHTLIKMYISNIKCKSCTTAINRSLSKNLSMEPLKDFTQILDKKSLFIVIDKDPNISSNEQDDLVGSIINKVEGELEQLKLPADKIETFSLSVQDSDIDSLFRLGYTQKDEETTSQAAELPIPEEQIIVPDHQTALIDESCDVEEYQFIIKGMTCAACALEIEHHFTDNHSQDVVSATVNFAVSNARVTVKKTSELDSHRVGQIINGLGFTALPLSQSDTTASRALMRQSLSDDDDIAKKKSAAYNSLALSFPLLFLILVLSHIEAVGNFLKLKVVAGVTILPVIEILIATPVVFYWGSPFFVKTRIALANKNFTMDVLVSLGVSTAYFSSLVTFVSAMCHTEQKTYHYGFHTAASLIAFMLLGKYIEQQAKVKTTTALLNLMDMQPSTASVLVPEWVTLPVKQIVLGDSVKVTSQNMILPATSIVESGEVQLIADNKTARKGTVIQAGTSIMSTNGVVIIKDQPTTEVGNVEVLRGVYEERDINEVLKGDFVKVIAGGSIPVDGIIKSGDIAVDESMLTGESIPVPKTIGDQVAGGSLCNDGHAVIRATAVGSDSCVSQIISLVSNAQTSKAPIQKYADRVAGVFVPAVIVYSAIVFIFWLSLGLTETYPKDCRKEGTCITFAVEFLIATLVIACPCAMGLATPTAVMVGTGVGAKNGIFIKGGDILEQASHCNTVVFDKTGTLSSGKISVIECSHSNNNISKVHLSAVLEVELQSSHPIAISICDYITELGEDLPSVTVSQHNTIPGKGVTATAGGLHVKIGSYGWFTHADEICCPSIKSTAEGWLEQGFTVVVASTTSTGNQQPTFTIFALRDQPKPEAAAVISHLQQKGVETFMVTGDAKSAAHHFADLVGIPQSRVFAEQLPKEKAEIVGAIQKGQLQEESDRGSSLAVDVEMADVRMLVSEDAEDGENKNVVAFIGDGINDAVALAAADVGIALGAGTSVALDAASCVLTRNNLRDVVTFLHLSSSVMTRIKLNFFWAFGYNVLAIPIASGFLYPIWHWQLPPTAGGIAMICSSIAVLLSSLHLKTFKAPKF
eukprot:TRINITY_DN2552_c6_g1_i2.p1 TRINITY_DN2552_c6_g1~~TRINITY_DN2552_c6_g1_i2.p1  ORF type:complete len:1254 (+),score=313.98 TRINITY_DN2552_c6_g1_i2:59-3763(+)